MPYATFPIERRGWRIVRKLALATLIATVIFEITLLILSALYVKGAILILNNLVAGWR